MLNLRRLFIAISENSCRLVKNRDKKGSINMWDNDTSQLLIGNILSPFKIEIFVPLKIGTKICTQNILSKIHHGNISGYLELDKSIDIECDNETRQLSTSFKIGTKSQQNIIVFCIIHRIFHVRYTDKMRWIVSFKIGTRK